ncbi:MAG: hypothetical protein JOY62_10675 [Acidobacteriaceae bacterium]|nr:hypothetical protein [Acidobacteriaceae bacterium]MBV9780423.1 hypothetical protein [Acidobacteriaceae bacterium]
MLEALWLDIRFAVRTLRKNAAFTVVAIATLALGIGANTAIFSLIDHVILRPLMYRDSERLYVIHEHLGGISAKVPPLLPVNAMHFEEWRTNLRSFDQMALIDGISLNLTGTFAPESGSTAHGFPPICFRCWGSILSWAGRFPERKTRPAGITKWS